LSNLQPVRRDFAFVVDAATAASVLVGAARGADKKLISEVRVFDVFHGGNLADYEKSVGLEVTLQPVEATLTDAEIEAVAEKITAAVEKASGGKLRG
jgi:phenylalanyl-tRNA synthetase beta chain